MQCRTAHLTIRELLSPVCCIFSPLPPPDNDVFNDPESLLKTLTVEKGENACTALSLFFFFFYNIFYPNQVVVKESLPTKFLDQKQRRTRF